MADPLGSGRYIQDTLLVFLERFVEQRKVLLVTDSLEAARHLGRKAASLDAVCPRSVVEQGEAEGVRRVELPADSSPLPLAAARFDAVVVPEIRVLGSGASRRIGELFSVLEDDGVMVVGTEDTGSLEAPDAEGSGSGGCPGYRELHRVLAEHFGPVRVLAQSPFIGTSIYDLAAAEEVTDIGFDGSLVEERNEQPVRVLLVGARENPAIEPFTVVQAPSSDLRAGDERRRPPSDAVAVDDDEGQHAREIRQLETLLRERGERIRELESDIAGHSALARDLMHQMRVGRPGEGGADASRDGAERQDRSADPAWAQRQSEAESEVQSLRAELGAATVRALEAEAARVEAVLRLDEVSGHLALAEASAAADAVEELEKERAALSGTVRGLRSAMLELEESRDTAEARLVLAMHDLDDAGERARILERELEETREQFELELARASGSAAQEDVVKWDEERAALSGEREGLRARCLDAERSVRELLEKNDALQRAAGALRGQIESLQASVAGLAASESVLRSRLPAAELRAEAAESRAVGLREALEEARKLFFGLASSLADEGGRKRSADGSEIDVDEIDPGLSGSES